MISLILCSLILVGSSIAHDDEVITYLALPWLGCDCVYDVPQKATKVQFKAHSWTLNLKDTIEVTIEGATVRAVRINGPEKWTGKSVLCSTAPQSPGYVIWDRPEGMSDEDYQPRQNASDQGRAYCDAQVSLYRSGSVTVLE